MRRLFLLVCLMLPLAAFAAKPKSNAQASSQQIDESTYIHHDGKEMYITFLDTVIVFDESKEEGIYKVKRPGKRVPTKGKGYQVKAKFSNGLEYVYTFLEADAEADFQQKRGNHIYNIRRGDIVVIKVKITRSDAEVLEFVENLTLKRH